MKLIKILVFYSVIFGLLTVPAYSQLQDDVSEEVRETIKEQLKSMFNQDFLISVYNQDESPAWKTKLGFRDPYGTLNDSYIFLARPFGPQNNENPNGFVGIFESGAIIWHSNREVPTNIVVNMELLGTMDLNRDGKVEIITQWYMGVRGGNTDLWIYSWDGSEGRRLNKLTEENKSAIEATETSVEIVDLEPDGIKEILGKNREYNLQIYSWNGQEYGDWGHTLPTQLPRDGVKSEIWAVVQQHEDKERLIFKYTVLNKVESLQSIEEFAVKNYFATSESNDQSDHLKFRNLNKIHLVSWQVKTPLDYNRNGLLLPGEKGVYKLLTNGLPKPSDYYVKGNNRDLTFSADEILTNSVSGTTLVPAAPPEPFEASAFTDTLLSYTEQACELEWISNRGICQSLQAPLQNTKRQLERGNTRAAANSVQAFLNEVEAVRRNHLTSEGYALLWYNWQYLLERLNDENQR